MTKSAFSHISAIHTREQFGAQYPAQGHSDMLIGPLGQSRPQKGSLQSPIASSGWNHSQIVLSVALYVFITL